MRITRPRSSPTGGEPGTSRLLHHAVRFRPQLRRHVVSARPLPAASGSTRIAANFFATLKDPKAIKIERVDVTEIDVLMLRNDPSIDAQTPWAMEAGILFGREAVRRGVIVLNDPDSLGRAINKLYFQGFPVEARAETLITKHASDIKAFAKAHGGNIILKPLQGSGGSGVFKLDPEERLQSQPDDRGDRPRWLHHRPGLCPGGEEGRHSPVPDERRPLEIDGKYAALRRVAAKDDIRSNIHAGGKAEAVEIGKVELEVAEIIRPKLLADGMFLDRGRHRRQQDPRSERLLAGQPPQLLRSGGRRFFRADPRSHRAQGRDQVAIRQRVRQSSSGDPLITGPAANRGLARVRFPPIADIRCPSLWPGSC